MPEESRSEKLMCKLALVVFIEKEVPEHMCKVASVVFIVKEAAMK